MSKGFKKIKKDGIFSKKFAITWKKNNFLSKKCPAY